MHAIKYGLVVYIFLFCFNLKGQSESPNIVFILADDLGYGDVSSYNENSKIITPSIDQLAANGIRFTDAHTSSSVCTPTRYGILTGRYNWRSTLKKGVLSGYSKALIKPERITIGKFLKLNGYTTSFIGKWHLGWDWMINEEDETSRNDLNARPSVDFSKPVKNGPNTRGFDYSYGFCGSLDMAPYVWVENDKPTMVPSHYTVNKGKQSWWRRGLTADDFVHEEVLPEITRRSTVFIDEHANDNKPFFLYIALSAPHTPILPTKEFQDKSGLENPYGDFVLMVDAQVGKIMKALENNGISENTILIFTSDNGCSPQADFAQLETKGHDPSYLFRGHKADIFEGGHRIPYIVQWPKRVNPGFSDQLLCTTDLYATVADILKASYPDNVAEDSYSFLSALGLESDADVRESIVHHSINGSFAYRKGNFKAIFCPGSGGWSDPRPISDEIIGLPSFQLYNLKNDIGEVDNKYENNKQLFESMRTELAKIVSSGRSTDGTKQQNDGLDFWPQLYWMK